jgi:hypothetical protein
MTATVRKLYEEDYYAWTKAQAEALRRLAAERWNGPLDLEHLAEEVEDLGSSQRFAVESQIERILEHLLKLEYSPAAGPRRGWLISILNARSFVRRRMTAAIRREVEPGLQGCYARSRRVAVLTMGEHGELYAEDLMPKTCLYSFEQVLDESWFPINQHGLVDRAT